MWQRPNWDQEKGVMFPFSPTFNLCQWGDAVNQASTSHPAQSLVRVECSSGGQWMTRPVVLVQKICACLKEVRGRERNTSEFSPPTFYKWHFVNGNPGSRCDSFFPRRYCPKLKFSHCPKLSPSSPLNPPFLVALFSTPPPSSRSCL